MPYLHNNYGTVRTTSLKHCFAVYTLQKLSFFNRIWHDNTGRSPSWYLGRVQVIDLQTDEKAYFLAHRWLAVEENDGQVRDKD